MSDSNLDQLVRLIDYAEQRKRLFPSTNSLQWYVRNHRQALIAAGALLMHCGQWHVHIARFDAYVIEAGRAAAQRHAIDTKVTA